MKNTKTDIQQEMMERKPSRPPGRGKAMGRLKPGTISNAVVGLAAVLATLSLVPRVLAQSYVFDNASFASGLRPVSVVTGDFNRDGVEDVAVVNQCGNDPTCLSGGSISILVGNPDGTFQSHVDYPLGSDPTFAVVGDFNGDGKPDIAVTDAVSNTISVLLGNGDGTFQSPVGYATGVGPLSAVAGDFNGDGHVDLAVANSGSTSVSILLGMGDGTFRSHVDYATSFGPQSVVAADFNGDGNLDLAVADSNVSVLLGNGDGTFRVPAEYPGNGATFVVAGDWNGDGNVDLAINGFDDTISVLQGKGDGTFQTPLVSYEVGGIAASIVSIDLNGDGHPDLVVGTSAGGSGPNSSGTTSVLLNKGDGTFQSHRDFGGMAARSLAAADFNGDGLPDVAVPNPDFNTLNIMLGDGRGALGSIFDVLSPPDYPTQVLTGDFNGDGKLDLGMGLQGSGSVAVALGDGAGSFQAPLVDNGLGAAPMIAAGDFNGDGKLDLVAFVYSVLDNVQILIGNGDGTFQPRSTFPVSNSPGQILTGDFNGDGKLDIATIGFGINIVLGNGDGTFRTPIAFPSRTSSAALAADFNADGKLDLAILSPDFTTLTVFLGNGDGTFQAGVDYTTGNGPVALVSGDFNGDGKPDLAVANAGSDTVSVFLGNGDGTFGTKADLATIQGPRSVAAGDFDGDGKTDLMVTGNGVSAHFGNGDGTFKPHQDYFAALDMGPAIGADFDGDGRPDLAVANQSAVSISVFVNRSAMALRPHELSFPIQLVGSASAPQVATVYNPGIFPLSIQSVSTTGDFLQTNTCGTSVAVGGSCGISATFAPTAAGPRSGTVTIKDNAGSGMQLITLTGAATDFSLGAATGANCPAGGNCSTSATIAAGQTATFDLQVSPLGGFNGTVSLSCAGGSTTCSVSPAAVPPNGSSSYAFTVTVANTANVVALGGTEMRAAPRVPLHSGIPLLFGSVFALLVCVGIAGGQTKRWSAPTLALLLLSFGCVSGCGSGGTTVTQPTHVTITVTASSGGLIRTLALSLAVNH